LKHGSKTLTVITKRKNEMIQRCMTRLKMSMGLINLSNQEVREVSKENNKKKQEKSGVPIASGPPLPKSGN
jgi:hypothetical protein